MSSDWEWDDDDDSDYAVGQPAWIGLLTPVQREWRRSQILRGHNPDPYILDQLREAGQWPPPDPVPLAEAEYVLLRQISDAGGSHRLVGNKDHRPYMDLEGRGLLKGNVFNIQDVTYTVTEYGRAVVGGRN